MSLSSSFDAPRTPALLMTMSASEAVIASAATESVFVTSSSTLTTRGSSLGFGARAVAYTLAAPRCQELVHDGLAESALSTGYHDRRPLDVDHDRFSLT